MKIKFINKKIIKGIILASFVFTCFFGVSPVLVAQQLPGPVTQPAQNGFIDINNLGSIDTQPFVMKGVTLPTNVCSVSGNPTFKSIVMNLIIGCILTRTAYLIVTLAIVVFLYGIFKFITSEGDDKQAGREFMFWGVIGIFVMISFWGLTAILQNTFNF